VTHGFFRDAPGQEVAPQRVGCVSMRLRNDASMPDPWESTEVIDAMASRMESWVAGHAGFLGSEPAEENG